MIHKWLIHGEPAKEFYKRRDVGNRGYKPFFYNIYLLSIKLGYSQKNLTFITLSRSCIKKISKHIILKTGTSIT